MRSGETSVKVLGYNPDASRLWRNYVFLGLEAHEVEESEIDGIESDTWIYLQIELGEEDSLEVSLESASSLPDQSAQTCIVPIAFIKTHDSKVSSIHQLQFGQLFFPSRVF